MGSSPISATRPVGQEVKTPPFHGSNTSSILVRVTKKELNRKFDLTLFLSKTEGVVYGIAPLGVWNHGLLCISLSFGLDYIPPTVDSILADARFHTATSCGFHTRLWRDLVQ